MKTQERSAQADRGVFASNSIIVLIVTARVLRKYYFRYPLCI
jgi:hypothetical protein